MSKHTTTITVQDVPVTVMQVDQSDYISLTDMAKARTDSTRAADVIKNWLRTRSTLEFLGTWEVMYNPDFKVVEFDHFKNEAGLHTFTLSAKEWIEKTNAIGMYVQAGRYGGTYAHKDIAFEFGSAISPIFMLGLSVLLFFAANVAAKGILALSKTIRLRILFRNPEPVVIKS